MNKTRVQVAEERGIEKGVERGELRALRADVAESFEARFGGYPMTSRNVWRASPTRWPSASCSARSSSPRMPPPRGPRSGGNRD